MVAPACWTIPSHAAMFTGLLPRQNGLIKAPGGRPGGCRPAMQANRERLLPEVLRRAGYDSRAASTNLWLTPESGFDIGFEKFLSVDTRRQARLHGDSLRARMAWDLEGVRARADDGAREALGVLRRWIGERRSAEARRPFLWFVNLVEAHSPYLPPRPYNDLDPIDRWRAAEEARSYLTLDAIWRACAGGFDVPQGALERMRHLYSRSIKALDDWLASVLESLDGAGLADETLVIVTSDHGENLGEQGMMGHAFSLDQRLTRVPFVAAGPGAPAAQEQAVSLAAVPRLIADAIELDDHPWQNGLPPPGVAAAQFDAPANREDPRVADAISRWGLGEDAVLRMTTAMTSATDGRHKLLLRGGVEKLFDLETDPLEESPLPAEAAARLPALPALRGAVAAAAAPGAEEPNDAAPTEAASPEEVQKLEERMRLLGYL